MSRSASPPAYFDGSSTIGAADILTLAWKGRLQLLSLAVAGAIVGGLGSLLFPQKYETHTSFVSVGGTSIRLPAGLSGLASVAQFAGLASALGGGESQPLSPYFFGDLVTSDALLTQLAVAPFPEPGAKDDRTLPLRELLHVSGRSATDSLVRTVKRLRKAFTVEIQSRTGVVTVTFTDRDPGLAKAVVERLTELLNNFVRHDLQTRAGDQRRFLETRIAVQRDSVLAQQQLLQRFLEANRDYRNAPALIFREAQLRHDLEFRQELALSLARSLEEARLNELRDLPVLSIIDRPIRPPRPSSPKPFWTALGLAAFAPLLWLSWLLLAQGRWLGPGDVVEHPRQSR
jgi:uncharacterized protein involved in exopolysaccharide biosynthesis